MGRFRRLSRGARFVVAIAVGGAVFGVVTAVQAAIPDSHGVIHGCYQYTQTNNQGGALRVIDKDKNQICRKLEKPLDWNQRGPTGPTGATGSTGATGPTGPGATSFATTLPEGSGFQTLADLGNGVTLAGDCISGGTASLRLSVPGAGNLQASGTGSSTIVFPIDVNSVGSFGISGNPDVDLDVIARDKSVGPFARVDAHGGVGVPCTFWGMIIPST